MALLLFGDVAFRRGTMNAARQDPYQRPKPTHTFWPSSRRPEPPSAAKSQQPDETKSEEHPPAGIEEPGYGHGV
jgi:hypothetical protein